MSNFGQFSLLVGGHPAREHLINVLREWQSAYRAPGTSALALWVRNGAIAVGRTSEFFAATPQELNDSIDGWAASLERVEPGDVLVVCQPLSTHGKGVEFTLAIRAECIAGDIAAWVAPIHGSKMGAWEPCPWTQPPLIAQPRAKRPPLTVLESIEARARLNRAHRNEIH